MKLSIATLLLSVLFSQASLAETYSCFFTEGFYTTSYNTESKAFGVYDHQKQKLDVTSNVSMKSDVVNGVTEHLLTVNGVVLQKLVANGLGNDGMHDAQLPLDAYWITNPVTRETLRSGCTISK